MQKRSISPLLKKAQKFAERIHKDQKRCDGLPYITHPMAVKNILVWGDFSEKILCAALLHDVLEDCEDYEATEEELHKTFGDEVAFLVHAVSKDRTVRNKKIRDEKYHIQFALAAERDPAVIFLKAADLLHNVSTVQCLSPPRRRRWVRELKDFYMFHFLKNFYIIPPHHRDFYHELMKKLHQVLDRYHSQ